MKSYHTSRHKCYGRQITKIILFLARIISSVRGEWESQKDTETCRIAKYYCDHDCHAVFSSMTVIAVVHLQNLIIMTAVAVVDSQHVIIQ